MDLEGANLRNVSWTDAKLMMVHMTEAAAIMVMLGGLISIFSNKLGRRR